MPPGIAKSPGDCRIPTRNGRMTGTMNRAYGIRGHSTVGSMGRAIRKRNAAWKRILV